MTGERSLDSLLRSMRPELRPEVFVFCTLPKRQSAPPDAEPVLIFQEAEGTTLILTRDRAEAMGLPYIYPCRMITLTVHSSLEAVGFLAAIVARLAESGISVNALSAYYHDHLFVPEDRAEDAMAILSEMSRS